MRLDLEHFETLEKQTAQVRETLHLPSEMRLDLALDSTHALNDLLRGLANLFPHKRSIARFGALPSPLQEVVRGFAREGFTVQEIPVNLKAPSKEAADAAMATLKKDTLFIAASFATPLLGALYPVEWVRSHCASKQMFFIGYGPSAFWERGLLIPQTPFEAFVYEPDLDIGSLAFWIGGERLHGENLFWGKPHFKWAHVEALKKYIKDHQVAHDENEKIQTVDNFELGFAREVPGVSSLLQHGDKKNRLYDRAVLSVFGCDGSALTELLSKKGYDVYSAAACHWGTPHLNNWMAGSGFSPEEIQSSLFIASDVLEKASFKVDLIEAVRYLRGISGYQA